MTILKDQLESIGKRDLCDFCYNGEEAVIKFSELVQSGQTVSYVLTDFQMPRLNGLQAMEKIQTFVDEINTNQKANIKMPIFVFITSYIET